MTQEDKKRFRSAKESLDEILRRIEPFRPKTPKAKPTEKREWQVITEGTFPSYPINNRSAASSDGL